MAVGAIWCNQCKLYQPPVDNKVFQTKQCPHCGCWVPIKATCCGQCSKALGYIGRRLAWIQFPVAGITALVALVATLTLGASNVVEYFNRDSSTGVSMSTTDPQKKSVELRVTKTGMKHSYIANAYLFARGTSKAGAAIPSCLDDKQQPLANTRMCNTPGSYEADSLCIKIPLKFSGRNDAVVKDDENYFTAVADANSSVLGIRLAADGVCDVPTIYDDDEHFVRGLLTSKTAASSCDVYYSIKESNTTNYLRHKAVDGAIDNCGSFLFGKGAN